MAPKNQVLAKHDDDVVIVAALRSALTKVSYPTSLGELLQQADVHRVAKEGLKTHHLKNFFQPSFAFAGSVNSILLFLLRMPVMYSPPGGARMAALHAGIPNTSAVNTVNRQCSSGLTAINQIAMEIKTGQIDIGIESPQPSVVIGAGVESMSQGYGARALPSASDIIMSNQEAADCLIPMGITSENVAADYKISREVQDDFAAKSFQKAAAAQEIIVDYDDGVRDGVTRESLAKLKPAFSKDGSTHAGNASQVSDGAAAVLLARRSVAKHLKLPILGKFVTAAVVGVPPRIMGVGPAYAIPRVLKQAGLNIPDIDFFEINEAFASQAVFSIQHLKIPFEKVNPVGGAIAMGHPLGCTGARQVATALAHAKRTGEKLFVTSMCIGSGMGMAAVFVNEQ
ncbi:hypothetical protein Clacol_005095 [Clathrus columnatus]|uniref:Uncharacterized protein n=1 Tax=Clathrus columnatus TaxID=1419009 RepID=A0AAV5AAZ8_9AGAM|nr:hypothetical protein Clacol_005095 [Clathrus columnatus]